jgi:hypothetical protein
MQAENPKSEARIPKQTRGLNKAQNPEISKTWIWKQSFVWDFFFAHLNLFRISDFVLRICFFLSISATSPAA